MTPKTKITKKNLRLLCWQAGYHGVAGVARAIGKDRATVHRAVSNPRRYGPTVKQLLEVLL